MADVKSKAKTRHGAAVYDTIREMALEYRFRPGEKINEGDLAGLLGVSRTPVREALSRLVTEGLIEFRRNYGFYCRKLNMAEVMTLAEAVRDVELALLAHVEARASAQELSDLRAYSQGLARTAATLPGCERARADEAFHARFADLAGNAVLAAISRNLNARIRFLRKIMMEEADNPAQPFEAQARIMDFLLAGQTEAARQALTEFLTLDGEAVRAALERGLGRIYLDQINMDVSFAP